MGFDPTIHRIMFKDKIHYVYELTSKEPSKMLYFQMTATIFNPHIACISGSKTRIWRAIQVTGSDGSKTKDNKEVVLKDVWSDKGSPKEKENQHLIYDRLRQVREKKNYGWIDANHWKRVDGALANMPDSLPFMRILHDFEGVYCKERLKKALPNRAILSPPECLVSSGKNVTSSPTQDEISYSATSTSHGVQSNLDPVAVMVLNVNTRQRHSIGWSTLKLAMLFMMLSQLTRHLMLLTMYSQVTRCLYLLNTVSADQHLPSPHPVVSGWLGPQRYQYRQLL